MNTAAQAKFATEFYLAENLSNKFHEKDPIFSEMFLTYSVRNNFFSKITKTFAYRTEIPFTICFAAETDQSNTRGSIISDFGDRPDSSGMIKLALDQCKDLLDKKGKPRFISIEKSKTKREAIFKALQEEHLKRRGYILETEFMLAKVYQSHIKQLTDNFGIDFVDLVENIWDTHEKLLEQAFAYTPEATKKISLHDSQILLREVPSKVMQRYRTGMTQLVPIIQNQLNRMSEVLEPLEELKETCIHEIEEKVAENDLQLFNMKISKLTKVQSDLRNSQNSSSISIVDISPNGFYDHPFPLLGL